MSRPAPRSARSRRGGADFCAVASRAAMTRSAKFAGGSGGCHSSRPSMFSSSFISERLSQSCPCARQPGLHGSEIEVEGARDLVVVELVILAQQEHGAKLGR